MTVRSPAGDNVIIPVSPCCFAVPGQDLGPAEGHWHGWYPVEARAALAGHWE